jgi:hypothetical protein
VMISGKEGILVYGSESCCDSFGCFLIWLQPTHLNYALSNLPYLFLFFLSLLWHTHTFFI